MNYLKSLVLVIAVLLLTSCAGLDSSSKEMSAAERDMHFKKVNEIEPAAGNISTLKELMKPRITVFVILE